MAEFKVLRSSNFFCMGVVLNPNTGAPLLVSEVTEVRVAVTESGADESNWESTPPPADVLFDEFVTNDPRWGETNEGYNFRVLIPAAAIPKANVKYYVEVEITPVSGPEIVGVWVPQTVFRPNEA